MFDRVLNATLQLLEPPKCEKFEVVYLISLGAFKTL